VTSANATRRVVNSQKKISPVKGKKTGPSRKEKGNSRALSQKGAKNRSTRRHTGGGKGREAHLLKRGRSKGNEKGAFQKRVTGGKEGVGKKKKEDRMDHQRALPRKKAVLRPIQVQFQDDEKDLKPRKDRS